MVEAGIQDNVDSVDPANDGQSVGGTNGKRLSVIELWRRRESEVMQKQMQNENHARIPTRSETPTLLEPKDSMDHHSGYFNQENPKKDNNKSHSYQDQTLSSPLASTFSKSDKITEEAELSNPQAAHHQHQELMSRRIVDFDGGKPKETSVFEEPESTDGQANSRTQLISNSPRTQARSHRASILDVWTQREQSEATHSHSTRRSPASVTSMFFDEQWEEQEATKTSDQSGLPGSNASPTTTNRRSLSVLDRWKKGMVHTDDSSSSPENSPPRMKAAKFDASNNETSDQQHEAPELFQATDSLRQGESCFDHNQKTARIKDARLQNDPLQHKVVAYDPDEMPRFMQDISLRQKSSIFARKANDEKGLKEPVSNNEKSFKESLSIRRNLDFAFTKEAKEKGPNSSKSNPFQTNSAKFARGTPKHDSDSTDESKSVPSWKQHKLKICDQKERDTKIDVEQPDTKQDAPKESTDQPASTGGCKVPVTERGIHSEHRKYLSVRHQAESDYHCVKSADRNKLQGSAHTVGKSTQGASAAMLCNEKSEKQPRKASLPDPNESTSLDYSQEEVLSSRSDLSAQEERSTLSIKSSGTRQSKGPTKGHEIPSSEKTCPSLIQNKAAFYSSEASKLSMQLHHTKKDSVPKIFDEGENIRTHCDELLSVELTRTTPSKVRSHPSVSKQIQSNCHQSLLSTNVKPIAKETPQGLLTSKKETSSVASSSEEADIARKNKFEGKSYVGKHIDDTAEQNGRSHISNTTTPRNGNKKEPSKAREIQSPGGKRLPFRDQPVTETEVDELEPKAIQCKKDEQNSTVKHGVEDQADYPKKSDRSDKLISLQSSSRSPRTIQSQGKSMVIPVTLKRGRKKEMEMVACDSGSSASSAGENGNFTTATAAGDSGIASCCNASGNSIASCNSVVSTDNMSGTNSKVEGYKYSSRHSFYMKKKDVLRAHRKRVGRNGSFRSIQSTDTNATSAPSPSPSHASPLAPSNHSQPENETSQEAELKRSSPQQPPAKKPEHPLKPPDTKTAGANSKEKPNGTAPTFSTACRQDSLHSDAGQSDSLSFFSHAGSAFSDYSAPPQAMPLYESTRNGTTDKMALQQSSKDFFHAQDLARRYLANAQPKASSSALATIDQKSTQAQTCRREQESPRLGLASRYSSSSRFLDGEIEPSASVEFDDNNSTVSMQSSHANSAFGSETSRSRSFESASHVSDSDVYTTIDETYNSFRGRRGENAGKKKTAMPYQEDLSQVFQKAYQKLSDNVPGSAKAIDSIKHFTAGLNSGVYAASESLRKMVDKPTTKSEVPVPSSSGASKRGRRDDEPTCDEAIAIEVEYVSDSDDDSSDDEPPLPPAAQPSTLSSGAQRSSLPYSFTESQDENMLSSRTSGSLVYVGHVNFGTHTRTNSGGF